MDQYGYAIAGLIVGLLLGGGLAFLYVARKSHIAAVAPKPEAPAKPEKLSGAPLRLLALLQAESRLIDFLMENIAAAPDAQVGLAVKDIHQKAQAVLKQHLVLETVLKAEEGETVTVPRGFDPSAIRVLGNVSGEPPYTGQVQHPGWRVKELKLNAPPAGADEFVLQAAEVHVG
jgi:hypothetical protein